MKKEIDGFDLWWERNAIAMMCEEDEALKIWQAAKSKADQKIKLLLCDEHLQKCESPTGVFNSQYPDEEPCLICLVKQHKAKAIPDGFVVVPKEPTQEMIDAADNCAINGKVTANIIYKSMIDAAQEQNHD